MSRFALLCESPSEEWARDWTILISSGRDFWMAVISSPTAASPDSLTSAMAMRRPSLRWVSLVQGNGLRVRNNVLRHLFRCCSADAAGRSSDDCHTAGMDNRVHVVSDWAHFLRPKASLAAHQTRTEG
jgi:hypothetical protein